MSSVWTLWLILALGAAVLLTVIRWPPSDPR
jgi:hypothetical protein